MAQSKPQSLFQEDLSCPICLQLFSEPAMLPCGHNFCASCIEGVIEGEAERGQHTCPECRSDYKGQTALQRNFKLCSIVEGFKASEGASSPVLCDVCLETPDPAVRTCLKCEISMCALHLKPHLEKKSFKSHALVEPTSDLSARKCSKHDEALKYYCFEDKSCICVSCTIEGEHKNHNVKSFKTTHSELRIGLESKVKQITEKLKLAGGFLEKARQNETSVKAANAELKQNALELFDNIIQLVNNYKEQVMEKIEAEQCLLVDSLQHSTGKLTEQHHLFKQIQQQAESVLIETDEFLFIQKHQETQTKLTEALEKPFTEPDEKDLNKRKLFEDLEKKFVEFQAEMGKAHQQLKNVFLSSELTLDPNTAHPKLMLSDDLKTVKYTATKQPYIYHPERFDHWRQVLCFQGLSSGEHYWELDTGEGYWHVGICYKSMGRKGSGTDAELGCNAASWTLKFHDELSVCHNNVGTPLQVSTQPTRLGVHLNYDAGTLTFLNLTDKQTRLHTFRTSFTEPVYPAFWIQSVSSTSWVTVRSRFKDNVPKYTQET
ncbi:E3 ubiquitin/ISG15 ligase TRIM25-like [Polyodon spathula]|uniref:E3 ubiquitin/ISG15 ligase TRIM25-like n=1 Tax=Polyodon spathula TaxID=7913 RepID=UPI001B7F7509|nr:E3 ubiquitin/ISG15 ligase TRIM25-like [Polyodon spathula]